MSDLTAGLRIRTIRRTLGLSQVELAVLLGVSNVTVNRWERGKAQPDPSVLERLMRAERDGVAALRGARLVRRGQLPLPTVPVRGREAELGEAGLLLRHHRLLTVTGVGGVGKTTVALELGRRLSEQFSDGVWFVDLAGFSEAEEAAFACVRVLGLREGGRGSVVERLAAYLGERHLLLILDSAERLLEPCREIAHAAFARGGSARLLITSREPLRLREEVRLSLAPLDPSEAVSLLTERRGDRRLPTSVEDEDGDLSSLGELCERLDCLPLAIELAAARLQVMSPEQLLERLNRRFDALGARTDGPIRQRTLRSTIDWSYASLDASERRLFRALGVLRGWFDMASVGAVAAIPDPAPLLERLSLCSMVVVGRTAEPDGVRYRLLDSLSDYALEKLDEAAELDAVCDRHADYFATRALDACGGLRGPDQAAHLDSLDECYPNVTVALQHLIRMRDPGRALAMTSALATYWLRRGRLTEGVSWSTQALRLVEGNRSAARAGALTALAALRNPLGQFAECERELQEAGEIAAELEDSSLSADVFDQFGLLHRARAEFELAEIQHVRALAIREGLGDSAGQATTTMNLGLIAALKGEHTLAQRRLTMAWALLNGSGDLAAQGAVLANLGELAGRFGRSREALEYLDRATSIVRRLGDPDRLAILVGNAAEARLTLGEAEVAYLQATEAASQFRSSGNRLQLAGCLYLQGMALAALGKRSVGLAKLRESAGLYRDLCDWADAALTVEAIAGLLAESGDVGWAARWFGGAKAMRDRAGIEPYPLFDYRGAVARVRAALAEQEFARFWDEGAELTAEQLLAEVELFGVVTDVSVVREEGQGAPLTARQIEVLELVAAGASNREIALRLNISPRTVERHLSMIFAVLETERRSSAAALAIARGWITTSSD